MAAVAEPEGVEVSFEIGAGESHAEGGQSGKIAAPPEPGTPTRGAVGNNSATRPRRAVAWETRCCAWEAGRGAGPRNARRGPSCERGFSLFSMGSASTARSNGHATADASATDPRLAPPPLPVPHATHPSAVPKRATVAHPSLYFNRELSWLDFNTRVLVQALDERVPLLERVRFLCIAAANLDEFFRKRVGGLKRQVEARVTTLTPDGRTPAQQLALAREAVLPVYAALVETWEQTLRPLLREVVGLHLHHYADLDDDQQDALNAHFRTHIFPILTPLAVDPGHPFPFISDLSLSFAITLRHPARGTEHFARLKVPTHRGRWLPLGEPLHYVPVEEVIRHNLHELFRGMEILSAHLFRVTRNVEPEREDDETTDLVEMIEVELRERRFAPVVRLEVEADMPPHVRELLARELELSEVDVYESTGLIDLTDCSALSGVTAPEHVFAPWEPVVPPRLARRNLPDGIFGVIREGDLLVHHPYESFRASVQRFVEEAAADPHVVAIKQTLYRTSDESGVVEALIRAAEAGKQVAVLVEVKARFDEENNLEWGEKLEQAGVHVTYGLVGLKTHAKVTLVVREEDGRLRTYAHFGTGNYHPKTARFYTDVGPVHVRRRPRLRPRQPLPLPHRLRPRAALPHPPRRPARHAERVRGPDPPRDPAAEKARLRAHHRQDERARRRGHDPGTLQGLDGRRQRGPGDPRALPFAAGTGEVLREHHRAQPHRALSGAQPDLLLREQRRPAPLHRLGGLAAPQPRRPRRDDHRGERRAGQAPARPNPAHDPRRRAAILGARTRRHVRPARPVVAGEGRQLPGAAHGTGPAARGHLGRLGHQLRRQASVEARALLRGPGAP